MPVNKNPRYPRIQRKYRISAGIYCLLSERFVFLKQSLYSIPMTKRFHYMKLVENIGVKNPLLANN